MNTVPNLLKTTTNNLRHFTSVTDVVNVDALSKSALQIKQNPLANNLLGKNKRIGLIFLNPSLRTRLSTQIAAENLGMQAIVFNAGIEGWSWEFNDGTLMNGTSVEHIKDAAPILGSYFDVLAFRSFPDLKNRATDYSEYIFKSFVKYVGKPVISLESATVHPLQSLADIVTIKENSTNIIKPKIVLTWAPHIKPIPQCVANSFAQWVTAWKKEGANLDFTIAHPIGLELDESFTNGAKIINDQKEALENADFIYVKNWSSYKNYGKCVTGYDDWMLKTEKLNPKSKIMHCLPVRRNVEISEAVLDGTQSLVTAQAANRVWATQAVLQQILL